MGVDNTQAISKIYSFEISRIICIERYLMGGRVSQLIQIILILLLSSLAIRIYIKCRIKLCVFENSVPSELSI